MLPPMTRIMCSLLKHHRQKTTAIKGVLRYTQALLCITGHCAYWPAGACGRHSKARGLAKTAGRCASSRCWSDSERNIDETSSASAGAEIRTSPDFGFIRS